MKQSADERPDPSYQRKAAIAHGAALDHTGSVKVKGIPNFDLNKTIFKTLEGGAARFMMKTRVGKEVDWKSDAAEVIQKAYDSAWSQKELPEVDPKLMKFLMEECDFDVEHADGSFLDHLYFCFEYGVQHYPQQSPLVLLLHSILGTGTNTFAMEAEKIPQLRELLNDFDWKHTEVFPSILRLLYHGPLRRELRENLDRLDKLKSISLHRVIDNEPITLSGEDFWIAMNYQLIHLVDFLPVSNWSVHQNDTSFILFRDLYDLMTRAGKLEAHIDYTPASSGGSLKDEDMSFFGRLTTQLPVSVAEKLTGKSIGRFSARIGHSLEYTLEWE